VLPEHHLSDESAGFVKLATGLIATMAALVLGLLISSAEGSFDRLDNELVQAAASSVRLDRLLASYGPETQEIRGLLKRDFAASVEVLSSRDPSQLARLSSAEADGRARDFERQLAALSPHDALQRQLQARALQMADEMFAVRWLALLQAKSSIPIPLLVALVSWLAIIFGTFGLYAPRNGTTIAVLVMCTVSTSVAIYLIMEMKTPLGGVVRISLEPMRAALSILGE
jgi:phosphatidylserine/phosphatidylglycerophosphate/cardiolipin synthase-like enzyme